MCKYWYGWKVMVDYGDNKWTYEDLLPKAGFSREAALKYAKTYLRFGAIRVKVKEYRELEK